MRMAKSRLLLGAVLVVCALLLLSPALAAAEPAGWQRLHGREAMVAVTTMERGRFVRKMLREEMVQADDDGVVDIAGSKRKSPGGPDPQHH
ncbi:hypothetical protein ACQJBY_004069 [Aegilops geniculata]